MPPQQRQGLLDVIDKRLSFGAHVVLEFVAGILYGPPKTARSQRGPVSLQ